jgi:hypothetical protein
MAGVLQGYIFNGFTRIMHQVPYWIVPFGIGESVFVPQRAVGLVGDMVSEKLLTILSGYWAYSWGNAG